MIVCTCRNIDSDDFDSEDDVEKRVMMDDWKCGLCQLYYEIRKLESK